MKCPKCEMELTQLRGVWSGTGVGEDFVKLQLYICLNKNCEAYKGLFLKDLKSGIPKSYKDISWTGKSIINLEKWKGFACDAKS